MKQIICFLSRKPDKVAQTLDEKYFDFNGFSEWRGWNLIYLMVYTRKGDFLKLKAF